MLVWLFFHSCCLLFLFLWHWNLVVQCKTNFLADLDALAQDLSRRVIIDIHVLFDQPQGQFGD